MSTAVGSASGGFLSELFRFGVYKPNQGRVVRQVSFVAMALLAGLAAFEFHRFGLLMALYGGVQAIRYAVLLAFVVVGLWVAYRVVNYSRFADFLIAVEAEMNKVSWPTKTELWNASVVVMFVIFVMAGSLFAFDIIWTTLFQLLGIRYSG